MLGVGGLGGWSALNLACVGVGEMLLVDFDRVELSNLNRQVLYSEADIGRFKAEAAAERLHGFNSAMKVEARVQRLDSEAAIAETIAGYDLVIDACDWPAHDIERWINSACFAARIPFIAMSHFPPVARVGPLYVPGVTGCFACQEIGYRRTYPLYDVAVEQQRGKGSPAATLGPACSLIGGQIGARHHAPPDRPRPALDARRRPHLRPAHDGGRPRAGRARAELPGLQRHAAILRQELQETAPG